MMSPNDTRALGRKSVALSLHPDSPRTSASGIEVGIMRRDAALLAASFQITGRIADIAMPALTRSVRSDLLWQHTCFEVLVGTTQQSAYYEFNFAPSTEWAAYRFGGYRSGQCFANEIGTPVIKVNSDHDRFSLNALVDLSAVSALPSDKPWRLSLSAVIESRTGQKAYWALAHPPGKPDFHHATCFALEIPGRPSREVRN